MDNKSISKRVIEECMNRGNLQVCDEVFASNWRHHDPQNPLNETGPQGARKLLQGYRDTFPDVKMTIERQIAEGDLVCTQWTARGTHKGRGFMDLAATNRSVTVTGCTLDRLQNGKIVETYDIWDTLGLLQQLGFVPKGPEITQQRPPEARA